MEIQETKWSLILQGQQQSQQGTNYSSLKIKSLFQQEVRMNMQSENSLSKIRAKMLESHRDAISRGRMSYVHAYYAANINIIFASHLP